MSKLGRNDPCYCGSGKKYKTCCMNKKTLIVDGMSESQIAELADRIQRKCIEECGENEQAAKKFWKELVTQVYDKDPAAVPVMIRSQPDPSNKQYMNSIYMELKCSSE